MSQTVQPEGNPKKFNRTKWSFVVSTLIAVVALISSLTVPEIRCSLKLKSDSCAVEQQEIQLITQAETGEPLPGVKIQYIAQGAPEFQYTDDSGFARVRIPSKGDVAIILMKQGYPTQTLTIDLQNDQSKTRTVRFTQSGKPEVTPLSPGNLPLSTPNQSATVAAPTPDNHSIGSSNSADLKKNVETLTRTKKCPNCYLVGIEIGINLSDADLQGANLRGARVFSSGVYMSRANLSGADLRGFSGQGIKLEGANLQGANLDDADLSYASLRGADLSNVDLSHVNLSHADLSGAILPAGFELSQ